MTNNGSFVTAREDRSVALRLVLWGSKGRCFNSRFESESRELKAGAVVRTVRMPLFFFREVLARVYVCCVFIFCFLRGHGCGYATTVLFLAAIMWPSPSTIKYIDIRALVRLPFYIFPRRFSFLPMRTTNIHPFSNKPRSGRSCKR